MKKVVIPFNFSTGFPTAVDLYYECLICGDMVQSHPQDNTHCKCENVFIDMEAGRVAVRDESQVQLVRCE
jgi:hypothetical protein